jgi:PAS domain S-box-containing protein
LLTAALKSAKLGPTCQYGGASQAPLAAARVPPPVPDPSEPTLPPLTTPTDHRVAQLFFAGGAAVALAGVASYGLLPPALGPGMRPLLVLGCLMVAAVFAALLWSGKKLPLAGSVQFAAWIGAAMTGIAAQALGTGVHSQVLGHWPLLIAVVAVIAGVRPASALTAACALMALLLGANDVERWWPVADAQRDEGLLLPLATIALLLGTGLLAGSLISFAMHRSIGAARERELRFRELLAMSVDWYWKLDAELRFVHFQTSPGMDLEAPADHRLGLKPWELSDFGLDDEEMDALRADLESHQGFSHLLLRRTDGRGRPRVISCSGRPRFSASGAFRGYWGVGRDITGETAAQQAITASETRYRELFERSPTPLVLHREGQVLDANPAAATMCGVADAADLVGLDLLTLYRDEASRERELARWDELDALDMGEGLAVADFVLHAPSGQVLSVQATAVRVMADGGPATLSIFFDVTARRAAEAALRRSETLLSHLFQTSPGCITLTDAATGRYVMVNPGFTRITGYAADAVIGRTSQQIGIWHDPADRERLVREIDERGIASDVACVFVARTGALVTLQISAAQFEMAGKSYLVINGNDITETERARSEHAAILQSAPVGIAFVRNGLFQRVNPSWERMFGWEAGRLAGERVATVWPDAPDAHAPSHTADGAAAENPLELELEMRRADGGAFWCRLIGQAVSGTHPGDCGTLWIAQDVTERRRVDQALASALDQAEAASRAKSAFLANTSHEIRTPLNGLLGLARMAQRPALDATLRQQYLTQLVDSAQSLAEVISDVLDLSKIEAGRLTLESVSFGLREQVKSVHRNYLALAQAKGLLLTLLVADDVPEHVQGDAVRTRQVLVNFLTNAIKFTESGSVQIELGRDPTGRVRLAVSDTGPGIDELTQRSLFRPFTQADVSTTRRYGGTGLGLSICRELVQLMGGDIGVHSVPGEGSRFWADLPLAPASPVDVPVPGDAEPDLARLRGARVLMVEDNPVNMLISVAQLEQWGAQVGQASDGSLAIEAVDQAARRGEPYDAVLMDLQMPRMGGHEAARLLRERYSAQELPIIALTAAALVSERQKALQAGMNDFVTKPIDPQQLLRALAGAL